MKKKPQKAMLTRKRQAIVAGMFETLLDETVEVRIMAEAEGYAMVRRKRAMPFVCELKDLKKI